MEPSTLLARLAKYSVGCGLGKLAEKLVTVEADGTGVLGMDEETGQEDGPESAGGQQFLAVENLLQDEVISVPILLQELKDISIDDR